MGTTWVGLVMVAALAGCETRTLSGAGGTAGTATAGSGNMTHAGQPPAACQSAFGPPHPIGSTTALMTELARTWLYCEGDFPIGPSDRQVGLEVTTDREWFVLVADASGAVVRGQGYDYQGTIDIIDGSSANAGESVWQVNYYHADGAYFDALSTFQDSPARMFIEGTGGRADYVAR